MSADTQRTEILELLTEIRTAGRGAFRSSLSEIFDRRFAGMVVAGDPIIDERMGEDFRDRLQLAVVSACAEARSESADSFRTSWRSLIPAPLLKPRTLAWGLAAIVILFLSLTLFQPRKPELPKFAPKDRPGITGPANPSVPPSKPDPLGPVAKKTPEVGIRSKPIPGSGQKDPLVKLAPPMGRFASVSGDVLLRNASGGRAVLAHKGTEFDAGSFVETGDMGRAVLHMQDGSVVALGFNTVVQVTGRIVRMESGSLLARVEPKPDLATFRVETPVATAEVLGTEFGLVLERVRADGRALLETTLRALLQVKTGKVSFYNRFGEVEATAMTESVAKESSKPTEPKRAQRLREFRFSFDSLDWTISVGTERLTQSAAERRMDYPRGWAGLGVHRLPSGEVRVTNVLPRSPAAVSGIRVGDTLRTLNGAPISSAGTLSLAVYEQVGQTLNLGVQRRGTAFEISMQTVAEGPSASKLPEPLASLLRAATRSVLFGNPRQALPSLQQIATQAPVGAALNNLGVAYELDDNLGDAIRSYKLAVKTDPRNPLFRYNLGLALQQIGNLERAVEELEAAVAHVSSNEAAIVDLARAYTLASRTDDAVRLLDSALNHAPHLFRLWSMRCYVLTRAGSFEDAIRSARKAIEADSDDSWAHFGLGRALKFSGQFEEAERAYVRSIELDPSKPENIAELGSLLADRGRLKEAEAMFRRALEVDPRSAGTRNKLGLLFTRMGRPADAEREFLEAIRFDPNTAMPHVNLGVVLKNQSRLEEAEEQYRIALRLDPLDSAAHYNLGVLFVTQRKLAEAVEPLGRALELETRRPAYYATLGNVLEALGRHLDAEAIYRALTEAIPTNYDGHLRLARVSAALSKARQAEAAYQSAIKLNPNGPEAYRELADFLARQNRAAEAGAMLRRAVERTPQRPDAYLDLAHFFAQRGRYEEATTVLRRAVELFPDNGEAHIDLGANYLNLRRLTEAEAVLRKGIALTPKIPVGHSNLGGVLYDLGRYAEAGLSFRKAAELQPANPQWPYELAMIEEKLGQPNEAEKLFRKAIEMQPGNSTWHDYLAHFLDRQGRPLEAVESYSAAATRNANDPYQWSEYGWSLIAVHRWVEALRAYRKCLEVDTKGELVLNSKNNLGFALIHLGRLREAETVLVEALKLKPENEETRSNWAYLLAHQGRDLDKARQLAIATTKPDSHAQRHLVLGFVHLKRGEHDEATSPLAKAAEGFGRSFLAADACVYLGIVNEARKDIPAALAAYRRALQIEPGNRLGAEAIKRLGG